MKKMVVLVFLVMSYSSLKAQTWSEWFRQKETQTQYLIQQIASLKVYTGYLKKGYDIAHTGLTAIDDIKKGDFNLHENYFSSLKNVNPRIKNYWKISSMVTIQLRILKISQRHRTHISGSHLFTSHEINYYERIFSNLLEGCYEILEQVHLVTTNGTTEMKDDERIRRIDALYAEIQDKYLFARHFETETTSLAVQRMEDGREVKSGRRLLGIH